MTSLYFLERLILNEVSYFIVSDQYEIFSQEGGIQGCVTILVTGQYIVLENIKTEYYSVTTASSSASRKCSLKISEKQSPTAQIQKSGNMGLK